MALCPTPDEVTPGSCRGNCNGVLQELTRTAGSTDTRSTLKSAGCLSRTRAPPSTVRRCAEVCTHQTNGNCADAAHRQGFLPVGNVLDPMGAPVPSPKTAEDVKMMPVGALGVGSLMDAPQVSCYLRLGRVSDLC